MDRVRLQPFLCASGCAIDFKITDKICQAWLPSDTVGNSKQFTSAFVCLFFKALLVMQHEGTVGIPTLDLEDVVQKALVLKME